MGNLVSVSISIDNLIPRCLDPMATRIKYARELDDLRDKLGKSMGELKATKNDTETKVKVAEGSRRKRSDQVQEWISRVDSMETKVSELISSSSSQGMNFRSKYKLGKKLNKIMEDVADLREKRVGFQELVLDLPRPAVDIKPIDQTVGMESMFDKVWRHLEEEGVGTIGLFGLGGVGKTTLLTKINNAFANTSHHFDVVIWVTVSKTPMPERIQNDIRKKIGIHDENWENKSLEDKVQDIYNELSTKKFVLLLDDVWDRLDLLKLGIPCPDRQNKCKVAFTTRSEKVCIDMRAHKRIKVECLTWEKAWDLFREHVGEETLNSDPEIRRLAQPVAKECGGLPLALITVGRAMGGKKMPQEWEYAIRVLKSSAEIFPDMEEVFSCLHFSYESLPNEAIRKCFLYCCLFPEDYEITKKDLIDMWIGEDFLDNFDGYEDEAKYRGYDVIRILLHACLLEEASKYHVKMHDVIRDMALWITRDCGKSKKKFFVQAAVKMTEAPEVLKWRGVNKMSLMDNKIRTLEETPPCHELSTLLLQNNIWLDMINRNFFQSMRSLKVLDFSYCQLSNLPLEVGQLTLLQHLNLANTKIKQLPSGLENLARLKYLNLAWTEYLVSPSWQVISRLSSLQVLDMYCSATAVTPKGISEALLEKLGDLKSLNQLGVTISDVSAFGKLLSSDKLQSCLRSLSFTGIKSFTNFSISSLLNITRLEMLMFSNCWDIEDMEIDNPRSSKLSIHQSFSSLHKIDIHGCHKIKSLTWIIFIPNLRFVQIQKCENLEEVISREKLKEAGEISEHFTKLEQLRLIGLQKLKSIYPGVILFPCLQKLDVSRCPDLKKLPLDSESAKGSRRILIQGERDWFDALEWENEATRNAFLPHARIL